MEICGIVAMTSNRVIGKEGRLPWHLPAELKYFKNITTSHGVVLGRTTYESIGKPLPNRHNLVLSRNKSFNAEGIHPCTSVENVLEVGKSLGIAKLFIIGGAEVYTYFMPFIEKWYITEIQAIIEGDTIFPDKGNDWRLVKSTFRPADFSNKYDLLFTENVRLNKSLA